MDGERTRDHTWSRIAVLAVTWLAVTGMLIAGSGALVAGAGTASQPIQGPQDQGPRDASPAPKAASQDGPLGGTLEGTINLSEADAEVVGETESDLAGWSVTNAGDVNGDGQSDVLVGVPANDTGGSNAGAAFLFYGPVDQDEIALSNADVRFVGAGQGDRAGFSVAAGDVNDDGFSDLVIGAPLNDSTAPDAGTAYVVYGNESLEGTMSLADADATFQGEAEGDNAGWSVAAAANITDEGTAGVLVGAPRNDTGGEDAGAAYVLSGEGTPAGTFLLSGANAKLIGVNPGDLAGWSVSTAGDVNGDDVAEVLVGASSANTTAANAGAAYVVSNAAAAGDSAVGEAGSMSLADAEVSLFGAAENDRAGFAVSDAGDVNGDGFDDVIVGAPYNDSTANDSGAAYVVYGGESMAAEMGLADAGRTLQGAGANDLAGWSVSSAGSGDVTCDGNDDLLVGAPFNDSASGVNSGAAYLVYGGNATGTSSLANADATLIGESARDRAGHSVSEAGDANGDGNEDVMVGAPYNDDGATDAGSAYVVYGQCPVEEPEEPPEETPEEPTTTETPEPFRPDVAFDCTEVTVTAEAYDRVYLTFADGSHQTFTGEFSGEEVFSGTGDNAGKVVKKVLVRSGDQTARASNPTLEECLEEEQVTTTTEAPPKMGKPPKETTTTEKPKETTTTTTKKPKETTKTTKTTTPTTTETTTETTETTTETTKTTTETTTPKTTKTTKKTTTTTTEKPKETTTTTTTTTTEKPKPDADKITLTAICTDAEDNLARFRITNDNDREVTVTYDVYQNNQENEVTIDANSEVFFTVDTGDDDEATVRLFYEGTQIGVKASNPEACDLGEENVNPDDITLTAICTDAADNLARFRISNENDREVTVTYDVYQDNQETDITVDANSETTFTVETGDDDEATVRLFYQDTQIGVKASNPEACDLGEPNVNPEDITLTALCTDAQDNLARFRITNDNDQNVTVTYDVYGQDGSDTGVTVDANSQTTFTVDTNDNDEVTVRLFYNENQIDVKANNPESCDLGDPNPTGEDLTLTAICTDADDNLARFRITNENDREVTVEYDVYQQDGSREDVTVDANSEVFVEVSTGDDDDATVRLFFNDEQIDVKASNPEACDLGETNVTGIASNEQSQQTTEEQSTTTTADEVDETTEEQSEETTTTEVAEETTQETEDTATANAEVQDVTTTAEEEEETTTEQAEETTEEQEETATETEESYRSGLFG